MLSYRSLVPVAILGLALAAPAASQSLPAVGATTAAAASTAPNRIPPGEDTGLLTDSGFVTSSIDATAGNPGLAIGTAESTVGGALRSFSSVEAAYGSGGPAQAGSRASWVAQFTTIGTDPGAPIDLDFQIDIEGVLDVFQNNGGPGNDDAFAAVAFDITLFDSMGDALPAVFSGTAQVTVDLGEASEMVLNRGGDWADASRDGDFSLLQATCGVFRCTYTVTTNVSLADAALVGFGDIFALEVSLDTEAFAFEGREIDASSDFGNTATVSISTSTPGVSLAAVPEPGTFSLCVIGMALLAARRRSLRA